MYIPGVYTVVTEPTIINNDIRAEEVRKLLTSFPKNAYVRVYGNMIDIIVDSTALYRTTLKTPDNGSLDVFIDVKFLSDIGYMDKYPADLFNCPWVEQNYFYIISNLVKGELVAKQDNLRDDPQFEELVNMNAGNGMKFYKLAGFDKDKIFYIPIFSGFPSINKQDTVNIEVFNIDGISVLVDMTIFKKKFNRNIEMIFKILNVCGKS